jgi:MFS family permease
VRLLSDGFGGCFWTVPLEPPGFWLSATVERLGRRMRWPAGLLIRRRGGVNQSAATDQQAAGVAAAPACGTGGHPAVEVRRLKDISPQQWKTGIAAWLGWTFDGLDMHLYTLVAAPFVATLLGLAATDTAHVMVKEKSAWIQGAFLLGWALGGGFFGRIGDRLGRSRALCLTILTYAVFTGLSAVAQTWWQLLIFRFLSALGVGGEWAVGSALLAETWPRAWRPWVAAVLQTGVNLGVLAACGAAWLMKALPERCLFLVGILPALVVFWIRRNVPEPEVWQAAKQRAKAKEPGLLELFGPGIRRITLLSIGVCALSLSGWWAFMFWHPQHLMNLPELRDWTLEAKRGLVAVTFFWVIAVSIFGNFFGGWLAKRIGYGRAIVLMFSGFVLTALLGFGPVWDYRFLTRFWLPLFGFWSGAFALFTMFLPPQFPTLLRTTGAGFCYNIGRICSAVGVVVFGLYQKVGDYRLTLLYSGLLFAPAAALALLLPEPQDERWSVPG